MMNGLSMTHDTHNPDPVEIIHFPDDRTPAGWHQPVLALGNFDGVHRGHAKIIELVRRRADERGVTAVALTFDPHPSRIVRPDKAPPLLMTGAQKLAALGDAGMAGIAVVRFTQALSRWEPEAFVRAVLVEWLRVSEVWVGANFLFGHDRAGNFSVLRSLGARYGFRAEKIDPVRYREFVVSSTRVRRLVAEGRVDEAGALLGHHYMLEGTVTRGAGRGRQLGFPTANLSTDNELFPPNGVYATAVLMDGEIHASVTNVGVRPTFGASGPVVESHIFDVDRDLYGCRIRVAFVQRLRDELAFSDGDALRVQIARDCDEARALFRQISL
ncbi:MAG: riboflavin biosynthesis protein RibF [Candidatus Neomarinimicrobiota bacterium]|nr:MAG: riboflavin biosynthesis protein RibF [Candidatus Neomarinimicrobiota bacterium]HIM52318.1 bifunctional riboflavin kinase/FAD synthetase [Acidobacteriota bacterium]